jgi:predicted enzyme related to lactoylglutathione lyase
MTSKVVAVTYDCEDAARVATFWGEVLGRPVEDGASAEFAMIGEPGTVWYFAQVPEGKTAKNRFHPDLATEDLDLEVKRLVELGAAELATYDEGGHHWVTLADPEGNEFDVIAGE